MAGTLTAIPLLERLGRLNPGAHVCGYGLYAPLNEPWLRSLGVDEVLGGEFEGELAEIARRMVDFPAPFAPISAIASPAPTTRLMPCSARARP